VKISQSAYNAFIGDLALSKSLIAQILRISLIFEVLDFRVSLLTKTDLDG